MNIDERLEALTHSVELLAGVHKDNEAQMQAWIQGAEKRFQAHEKQMKRMNRNILSVLTAILDHEHRLRDIEGEDDDDTDSALV
jgi:hypothetical protein